MRMRAHFASLAGLILAGLLLSGAGKGADVYAEATHGQVRVVTPEFFGTHFHRLVLRPGEKAVRTQWPELPFGTIRLWDSVTRWADIAPKAGYWNFERLDTYVHAASEHHAKVLYTLGSTPRWASPRPDERCPYGFGCAAEPVRMEHWEEYVRRVSNRYRGGIETYELWNEPHFSDFAEDRARPAAFFSGSVADMVEMARLARKVLDETDPGARLATPGFLGGGQRHLDLFLRSGGKQYVQVITYHFYAGNAEEFARKVIEVRGIMRRHGVENLPLWNTESGFESWPVGSPLPADLADLPSARAAGARMAQVLTLGAASGLERFYHFAWDNDWYGTVTRSGTRLPGYQAMSRVQQWLIGARLTGCSGQDAGAVACRGDLDGQPFLIAWSDSPGSRVVRLPENAMPVRVETLYGDCSVPSHMLKEGVLRLALGPEPVRIVLARPATP